MTRSPRGKLTGIFIFGLSVITSAGTSEPEFTETISIANGIRYTVAGAQIDAHSGTILRGQDNFFYWYGEAYACGFHWTDPGTPYCGAQVYRSPDMSRWQGPWPLFDAWSATWQDLCMHQVDAPGNGCFRPKVVYNETTQLYVLWLNTGGYGGDGYRVLTSRTPMGPFKLAAKPELHDSGIKDWRGNPRTQDGDEGLFVDAGGSAWLTWSRGGRLLQERLNSEYTSGTGPPTVIMNYPQYAPWAGVESPSEFEHGGRYYLAMSLPRCPYCVATGTAIERASSPNGPWSYRGMVTSGSCDGQPNEVDEIAQGMLLWSSDQWVRGGTAGIWPKLNETGATQQWEPISFNGADVAPITCATKFAFRLDAV